MAMQVDITKQILSLGSASAGFYTPQFQDRAMKLQMFCLGRHWEAGIIQKKDSGCEPGWLMLLIFGIEIR